MEFMIVSNLRRPGDPSSQPNPTTRPTYPSTFSQKKIKNSSSWASRSGDPKFDRKNWLVNLQPLHPIKKQEQPKETAKKISWIATRPDSTKRAPTPISVPTPPPPFVLEQKKKRNRLPWKGRVPRSWSYVEDQQYKHDQAQTEDLMQQWKLNGSSHDRSRGRRSPKNWADDKRVHPRYHGGGGRRKPYYKKHRDAASGKIAVMIRRHRRAKSPKG